jgi:hypothetical protein
VIAFLREQKAFCLRKKAIKGSIQVPHNHHIQTRFQKYQIDPLPIESDSGYN